MIHTTPRHRSRGNRFAWSALLAVTTLLPASLSAAEEKPSMSSMKLYPFPIDPGQYWRANAAFGGESWLPPVPTAPRTNPVPVPTQVPSSASQSSAPRATYTPQATSGGAATSGMNQSSFQQGQAGGGGGSTQADQGGRTGQSQFAAPSGPGGAAGGGTGGPGGGAVSGRRQDGEAGARRTTTGKKRDGGGGSVGAATVAPVTVSGKSGKEPVMLAQEASLVNFGATAGYYSHYLFRGLDVGYRTGIDSANDSDFFGASASMSIGNFGLGFWYMHSLDSYVPGGAGFDGSFGRISGPRNNRVYANDLDFRTPARQRYQEYDLFLSYDFRVTDDLVIRPGMNFYFFSDGRFWANGADKVDSTMEASLGITYTGIKGLNQSLNYIYDFDAFEGGYLEYRLATNPIKLYQGNNFAVGLVPSIGVSYDFKYNGTNNGWNNIEPGIDIPIQIADGLVLNLGARYALDLGDASTGAGGRAVDRTDDRLYFSAVLQFNWGNYGADGVLSGQGDTLEGAATFVEPPGPWTISAGVSTRTIDADFDVGAAAPYNLSSLFSRRRGGGDLHLASKSRDAHYLDGSVYSASGTAVVFNDGTSTFSFQNQNQLNDPGRDFNRQLYFTSQRFSYSESFKGSGFSSSDDDQPIQPYINFAREVRRWDRISLGFGIGYSFGRSSFDSGTGIVGIQTLQERQDDHLFTYDVDEFFSMSGLITPGNYNIINSDPSDPRIAWVVFDGNSYSTKYTNVFGVDLDGDGIDESFIGDFFPNASPQHHVQSSEREVARIAVFRGSSVDVDSHVISAPVDLSFDLTKNLTAKLSFGPTLNIFNVDMRTDTYYQLLNPQGGVRKKGGFAPSTHRAPYFGLQDNTGSPPDVSFAESYRTTGNDRSGAPKSFVNNGSGKILAGGGSQQAGVAGGGKGSADGRSRRLPGVTLAHLVNRYSGQELEWGVFGQLALQADLDAQKRWFMEAFVRYDYVPEFTVSDGATSVSIDASSWGAGVGVGFRF